MTGWGPRSGEGILDGQGPPRMTDDTWLSFVMAVIPPAAGAPQDDR